MTPYERVVQRYHFPFPLRPYQVDEVNELATLDRCGFYWEPGCVDSATEYLSPTGWVRISEYGGGLVGQYHLDTGNVTMVQPSRYIKAPQTRMIRIKTHYGLDQLLSPEHRVIVGRSDRPGRLAELTAQELLDGQARQRSGEASGVPFGFAGVGIPTVFSYKGGSGIELTDDQLRLQVAVIADGHFGSSTNRCVIRVKRPRKVQRLRALLTAAEVSFKSSYQEHTGFTIYTFPAPLRVKEFDARFWEASERQLGLLASEVVHWDGSDLPGNRGWSFSSTSKASADFVQFLWILSGRTSRVSEDRREKYSGGVCYSVTARGGRRGGPRGLLKVHNRSCSTVWEESSTDGFKYCFTVPTAALVLRRNGCVFVTGNSGKTAGSSVYALFWALEHGYDRWVCPMPPILMHQWQGWLQKIVDKETGKPITATVYAGTPKQRAENPLQAQFTLCSYDIFKRDFERLYDVMDGKRVGLLCDEATAIKNIESDNHKAVATFSEGRPLTLLTGTPVNKPLDGYAYIKLLAPSIYRNRRQFLKLHVAEEDDYGNATGWKNLDLLASSMRVNTSRILVREVRHDLPPVVYTPIQYELDPAHLALYRRIAKERLVEFEGRANIDAVSAGALRSALQQVVMNWAEFEGNPSRVPAGLELIEEILEEIGDKKLVVAAHFIRTNRYLLQALQKYNAVAVYGEVSPAAKQRAIQTFKDDKRCRVMLVQPSSAGYGVDGLQHVCSDMLVVEAPTTPTPFEQVVKRLDRDGQLDVVNIRVGIARRTVQVDMFRSLLENDALANQVQGGYRDLKESIYGE